jgi:chromosome segregation ATPase
LKKELKLSETYYKSSQLSAKRDLIKKLDKNISQNKTELNSIKQDYFNIKNQRNQILEIINDYEDTLNELNQRKKEKFSEINKITRTLESTSTDENGLAITPDLSDSMKIKELRREAKTIHERIKELESKLRQKRQDFSEINPKFQTVQEKYNSLKDQIYKSKTQIKKTQAEIEKLIQQKSDTELKHIDQFEKIRSPETLKEEIIHINKQLERLKKSKKIINDDIIETLTEIDANLLETLENLEKTDQYTISTDMKKIISSIELFRKLELLLAKVESLMNRLLGEINLNLNLQITITENNNEFYLTPIFTRNKESNLVFNNLTTPEKVYYATIFYITLKIILSDKTIFFSNLFLHPNFNKRGSLFRTFRKITPLLRKNPNLQDFQFIAVISNLKMKNPIENIKIIDFTKKK